MEHKFGDLLEGTPDRLGKVGQAGDASQEDVLLG